MLNKGRFRRRAVVPFFPQMQTPYAGAVHKDATKRKNLIEVAATTIDEEVSADSLKGPYGVKLDTHGTEIDILTGASDTLTNTSLICIETYALIGQKRFPEMLLHLQDLGFRVADIAEPLFRPSDAALWQLDFYLLRSDHAAFRNFDYP